MSNSASLIDKIIIFTCCLSLYLFQANASINIAVVLAAIIFGSFLSYFDQPGIKAALNLLFIALLAFFPDLILFLPLIVFDMVFYKYQYLSLFGIIPLVNYIFSAPAVTASALYAALIFSLWIRYRVEKHNKLQKKHDSLDLTTREISIQLKKQNSDLIEKQDNEMNMATLNERNRIAREIHDNVGHLLSSAILQSGALLTINRDEKVKEHLEILNGTLNHAMNSIRASVHGLYDESIDLNAQAGEIIRKFTFCETTYDYNISSNPPQKLKYAFISILKEALSNIMKHSNANHATIVFREHPALYQLIIRDNGNVKSYSMDEGMGLKNIMERVESLNGIINIITENGFDIFISVPKEAAKA